MTSETEGLNLKSYVEAINNLDAALSRDCYFYYVVPIELQREVADQFNNEVWRSYTELESFKDRLHYRKVMVNTGNTFNLNGNLKDTDTEDDEEDTKREPLETEDDEPTTAIIASAGAPVWHPRMEIAGMIHYMELLFYTIVCVYILRVVVKLSGEN